MEIGILSALLLKTDVADTMYTKLFTTVSWVGDTRPCHHACAVQQWRHRLTACLLLYIFTHHNGSENKKSK